MVMYFSNQNRSECCICHVKSSMFQNIYLVEEEDFRGYCWEHLPSKYKAEEAQS